MSSLMRVRPTKIELIRLRKRLALARKVHRILRERLTILVNEFLAKVREAYRLREEVTRGLNSIYREAVFLYGVYGERSMEYYRLSLRTPRRAIVGQENIMGVKTVTARLKEPEFRENPMLVDLDEYREKTSEILAKIIELGKIEKSLDALGREILRTKRKVNALEYTLIPQISNTIRYLRMKFEEREREEKARLKRVKAILSRKRGG